MSNGTTVGCAIFYTLLKSKYLTDIPREREEYGVPYHFYSSSWSGISVLLDEKLTLPFWHIIKQTILPNSDPTRRGLSGRSPT